MSDSKKSQPSTAPRSKEREVYIWQKPEDLNEPKIDAADVTITNAIKTIKPDDFKDVTSIPCAKTSLESGIIAASVGGVGRFIWKGNFKSAANWAVGVGLVIAAGAFEYCNMDRKLERIAMKKMIEVHNEKSGTDAVSMGSKKDAIPIPLHKRGMQIDTTMTRAEREVAMIKAREAEQAILNPHKQKSWWKLW